MSTNTLSKNMPSNSAMGQAFSRWLAFISYSAALFCTLPFILVTIVATSQKWRKGFWGDGFTLEWLLAAWQRLAPQMGFSIKIALLVLALNMLVGLPAAWAIARQRFWGRQWLLSLNSLPLAIPGIAIALALILRYPQLKAGGYLLVLGHMLYTLPFFIAALTPVLAQANVLAQEEVARTLGIPAWQRFYRITLPSIRRALLAAALLCFTLSMGEFNVSFFLYTPLYKTLPVDLYDVYMTGRLELAAGMTVIFLLFVVPASLVIEALGGKSVGGV